MDTGKILMGTALLLLMIGLVVHPANAAQAGCIYPVQNDTTIGDSGQIPTGTSESCKTGAGPSIQASHAYERMIISTATSLLTAEAERTG